MGSAAIACLRLYVYITLSRLDSFHDVILVDPLPVATEGKTKNDYLYTAISGLHLA